MNLEQLEEVVSRVRQGYESNQLSEALISAWEYYEKWRAAAMECSRTGRTSPCASYSTHSNDGLLRCFKCGCVHPRYANEELSRVTKLVEEDAARVEEAIQLAVLLSRSTGGISELQWVAELSKEIINRLKHRSPNDD